MKTPLTRGVPIVAEVGERIVRAVWDGKHAVAKEPRLRCHIPDDAWSVDTDTELGRLWAAQVKEPTP